MALRIVPYAGVNEIGGNKILIEDRNTRIMLDFGLSYSRYGKYYSGYLRPRVFTGLQDLSATEILPDIPGVYRNDLREIAGLKTEKKARLDAVLLSHAHSDHSGHISYLRPEIPVYCSRLTLGMMEALEDMGNYDILSYRRRTPVGAPWRNRPIIKRTFEIVQEATPFKIKNLEVIAYTVDHSIPGSTGFLVNTSEGWIAFTGDIRFHGRRGGASDEFVHVAAERKPSALITEGTNIEDEFNSSEEAVYDQARRIMQLAENERALMMVSFSGRDLDRLNTFLDVATAHGRVFAVSLRQIHMLESIAKATTASERSRFAYNVPDLKSGKLAAYLDRRMTGTYKRTDYRTWARKYISKSRVTVRAPDIHRAPHKYVLALNFMDLQELTDIRPGSPFYYIHSSSSPWSKPMEVEDSVLRNWLSLYGGEYHQIHASGHAAAPYLHRMIETMKPGKVIPIHTEKPELFHALSKNTCLPECGRDVGG